MTSAVHEYAYTVPVKSRFDVFASDAFNNEDPDVLLKKLRSQKRERKTSLKSAPEKAAEESKESFQKDAQVPRKDHCSADKKLASFDMSNAKNRVDPRGGVARGKGGQREFDRHSGSDKTGVKPVVKKDGHGTGNWGTIKDELEAQTEEILVPLVEEKNAADESNRVKTSIDTSASIEEQPKTYTLKEYRNKLKASKTDVQLAKKPIRPPNDGKNVFSDMVEVHKSKPLEKKVEIVLPDVDEEDKTRKPAHFELARGEILSTPNYFRGRGALPQTERRSREKPSDENSSKSPAETELTNHTDEEPSHGIVRGAPAGFRSGRGREFAPRGEFGGRGRGFGGERGRGFVGERGRGFGGERGRGIGGERGRGFGSERGHGFGGERGRGFGGERGHGFGGERGRGIGGERGRGFAALNGFGDERRRNEETDGAQASFPEGDERNQVTYRGRLVGDRSSFRGSNRSEARGMRGGGSERGVFGRGRRSFDNRENRGNFRGESVPIPNVAPSMDSDADFPALK